MSAPMSGASQASRTEFYERLHNLLWNDAGLDPHQSLEHLTFFFSYYLMEPQIDRLGLPVVCKWSYLVFILNQENPEYHLTTAIRNGIDHFMKNPITKPFFSVIELIIPGDKRPVIVRKLVEEITTFNAVAHDTDTLGDVFEYIYGRGATTIPDAGQYFTPRNVCKVAFDLAYKVRGTIRHPDGRLCTFADFFCGTGGFATSFVKGVKKMEPLNDWSHDHLEVYCLDKSVRAVTTTLLNLLILTGQPFDKHQIREHNSFQDNITIGDRAPFKDKTFDFVFSNPPFGGDKNGDYGFKFSRTNPITKVKEYLVNKEIQSIGVEDNSKSNAGLQLAMATLAPGGVCCMVLPQGFFFSSEKKVVALRTKLIEEYRVHYILGINAGSFANTTTTTSMVVFQRGVGPTESIHFLKLDPSAIDAVSTIMVTTLEQLRRKNFSLDHSRYTPRNEVIPDGFHLMKLGDLLESKGTGKTKTTEISKTGEYPFYSCTAQVPSGTHSSFDFDGEEYLLFSRAGGNSKTIVGEQLGIGKFHLVRGKCAASAQVIQFKLKTNAVTLVYLHYVLQTRLSDIQRMARYTTGLGSIDTSQLMDFEIPVPSRERQEGIETVDLLSQLIQSEKESISKLERIIFLQIKTSGYNVPSARMEDIVKLKSGTYITKESMAAGEYPVYGGGTSCFSVAEFNRENQFVISKDGISENCVRYVHGKFFLNHHGWTFDVLDGNNYFYVGYWLLSNKSRIFDIANGTVQKGVSQESFYDMELYLPSPAIQGVLRPFFDDILIRYYRIDDYNKHLRELIRQHIPAETVCLDCQPDVGNRHSSIPAISRLTPPSTPSSTISPDPIIGNEAIILSKMTIRQLTEMCKSRGIKGYSGKKKEQLVSMLQNNPTVNV